MTVSIVLDVTADAGKVDENHKFLVGERAPREEQRVVRVAQLNNVMAVCPDKRISQSDMVMVNAPSVVPLGQQLFTLVKYKATFNLVYDGPFVVPNDQPIIRVSTPRLGVNLEYAPVGPLAQILFDGGRINNMLNKTADIPQTVVGMWNAIPKMPVAGTNLCAVIGTCVIRTSQQNLNKVIMATNVGKLPVETGRRLYANLAPIPFPIMPVQPSTVPTVHPAVPTVHPAVPTLHPPVPVFDTTKSDDEDDYVLESPYHTPEQSDDEEEDPEDRDEVEDHAEHQVVTTVAPHVRSARITEMDAEIAYLEARLARVRLERAAA